MTPPAQAYKNLCIRLSVDEYDALHNEAKRRDVSKSQLVKEMIAKIKGE